MSSLIRLETPAELLKVSLGPGVKAQKWLSLGSGGCNI
jgi:hypothetical protein